MQCMRHNPSAALTRSEATAGCGTDMHLACRDVAEVCSTHLAVKAVCHKSKRPASAGELLVHLHGSLGLAIQSASSCDFLCSQTYANLASQ